MNTSAIRSIITGVGYYLPSEVVGAEDVHRRVFEASQFHIPNGLIQRATGIVERRYRDDDEQSSDLALKASLVAMERAEVTPKDIDLLIFASCTQDVAEPATANILQEKLGLPEAQVFDAKNACNSFLTGLDIADSHIRAGKSKCALVAVGETLSLTINWHIKSIDDLRARISSLTLGDAGGAVVLKGSSNGNGRGILSSNFRSYGEKWRLATVLGGGSMHRFEEKYCYFTSSPQGLMEAAYEHIPGLVADILKKIGWSASDVEVACAHQVSEEMVHGLAERCGIGLNRTIVSVTDCGNTAAASIPICLGRAYERGMLKPGTKVLLVGGAAGFSVGAVTIVW